MTTLTRRGLKNARELLWGYGLRFGVVGICGYAIDIGLFNLLRVDLGNGPILGSSFTAKAISVSSATLATWLGNRYWTFHDRRRHDHLRELLEFVAVAGAGMVIALACLYVSRNVIGAQSLLADNIAANGVGLILGTAFRLLMYRYWVYGDDRTGPNARGVGAAKAQQKT